MKLARNIRNWVRKEWHGAFTDFTILAISSRVAEQASYTVRTLVNEQIFIPVSEKVLQVKESIYTIHQLTRKGK